MLDVNLSSNAVASFQPLSGFDELFLATIIVDNDGEGELLSFVGSLLLYYRIDWIFVVVVGEITSGLRKCKTAGHNLM